METFFIFVVFCIFMYGMYILGIVQDHEARLSRMEHDSNPMCSAAKDTTDKDGVELEET